MPDITFVNSQKSEEYRWSVTREEVENGWFANHGFLVVPELREGVAPQIQVVFPKTVGHKSVDVGSYQQAWTRVEELFWVELDHYLPEARKLHTQVVVDIGRIGTVSSSYWSTTHYYLRSDRGVADLAAMMINQTLRELRKELGITWTKREALMDFVMTRPAMKKLFPEFSPVYSQLLQVPAKIRRESERYIHSLGFVVPAEELVVRQGKLVIKNAPADHHFGKCEKILLKILIERRGELVTYDELADAIWGEGEFKSFWALAKLVERMRGKLAELGIAGERVESVRGQGYLLR